MYAVTGITGKVGGAAANALLEAGQSVRAVVRDEERGKSWASKGCAVAVASVGDAEALTKAFSGTEGAFLMTPPDFDPEPGFPETRANAVAIKAAIEVARPAKVRLEPPPERGQVARRTAARVANGWSTSIAHPTSRRSPRHPAIPVRAWI